MSLKVNAEKEGRKLAEKHGVRGFPTILFLDKKGEVAGRIGGFLPGDEFAAELTRILDDYKELPQLKAALKKEPNAPELNAKYAVVLANGGKKSEAESALKKAEKGNCSGALLAKAYSAIGDLHGAGHDFAAAIEYFQKAEAATANVRERAYAKVSIMQCYMAMKDNKAAKKTAKELLALKNAPPEYVDEAHKVLGR